MSDLVKTYVTFGQDHLHTINGKVFDKDCVGVINASSEFQGRERAFEIFDGEFFTTYTDRTWNEEEQLKYFPRGYIEVE